MADERPTGAAEADAVGGNGSARRILALIRKEAKQVVRDPTSVAIAIVLPVLQILLFGYALSLDVKHAPIALVIEQPSPLASAAAARIIASPYLDARVTLSIERARALMAAHEVDGIVAFRADFDRLYQRGEGVVQVIARGTDAITARTVQGYVSGALAQWQASRAAEDPPPLIVGAAAGSVALQTRAWFNPTGESRFFLVPGLLVLVMTLIGALMTALVMAREWERGTLEALFVTPVRAAEILVGKTAPYFILGMIGLTLCLLSARFLFHVPVQGSLIVLIAVSALYLLVALGLGLWISAATKNQLVASQLALLTSFMPAFLLSGFIFDIGNMPAWLQALTHLLPARYYVALLQTIFLAGDVWSVILPNAAVLALMAVLLLYASRRATRKRLQ